MKPGTHAVHGGEAGGPSGAVNTPIVHSTTYAYPELEGVKSPYIYTRYENPTTEAVEAKLAALEGAKFAYAFSSGMAAIAAVCQSLLKPGDVLAVQRGVYGGTTAYLTRELAPSGIEIRPFDLDKPDFAGATLVWVESISNPLLAVADVPALAEAAHQAGALLAVDATFASPMLQRPLALGADIVMHSGTKYLNGHSDVTCGFVAAHEDCGIWETRRNLGSTLDPLAASLVGRGMKTLAVRVQRQVENATAIAHWLAKSYPVRYPLLHAPATIGPILDGPGAMVSFDVGSYERAVDFRRRVQLFKPAASLGGVESLLSLPRETSHAYATPEERLAAGITDGLIRISVGIEDVADLLADLEQALA